MPDLLMPTTPRPTLREDLPVALKAFVTEIAADPPGHAAVLAAGAFDFKPRFAAVLRAQLRHLSVPVLNHIDVDQLARRCFAHLEGMWTRLHGPMTPRQFLQFYIPEPEPTADEIACAWEVEIASSESYMRTQWEGSRRVRTGRLEALGIRAGAMTPMAAGGGRPARPARVRKADG